MNILNLYENWKMGKTKDSDMALSFFLHFYLKKYPNPKLQNETNRGELDVTILDRYNFKKVKGKAITALKNLVHGKWDFKLIDTIPTAYEVLEYQARGIRPVTIRIQPELKPILNRADCLEFFLHDLEHGYMFFYDVNLKKMQMIFFQNVFNSLKGNIWQNYLIDENFRSKFFYLISDMNTHIEHYRFYLKSMVSNDDFKAFEFLFKEN